MNGRCVRLKQGDFSMSTQYGDNPLDIALNFQSLGFKRLHVVDLDAAKGNGCSNFEVIERLVQNVNLKIDVGGGIRSKEQVAKLFELGVDAVNIGSLAIKNPDAFFDWLNTFGTHKIWLSADVREGFVAVNGWQNTTDYSIEKVLQRCAKSGLTHAVITAIERDGMLSGPDVLLYEKLVQQFPEINIIASGGVSTEADLSQLSKMGIRGAIVGKALLENPDLFSNRKI
jgi:phosphoribosylformimino-5-aminoimidazole carboxamide ribotide isomerase